jgi:hypothetical protein
MTIHTLTAEIEIKHQPPGMGLPDDEYEVSYPEVEITYRYTRGRPAYTPRGEYGPIDPADPAEVELVGAKLINGDGLLPEYEQVREWAENYLDSDKGYQFAIRNAEGY